MSEAADPIRVDRQRRLIAAHAARRAGTASALEGMAGADAPMPHPDDVLSDVADVLGRMPPAEVGNAEDFARAMETLLRHGEPALRKLVGGAAPVTGQDSSALEAIIIANGDRPSFLLKDGLAPAEHPFLRDWKAPVALHRERVRAAAAAVGRVQPVGGGAERYLGTATLVSVDPMLALTNYHVLSDAQASYGVPLSVEGGALSVGPGLEIDFVGEAAGVGANRFRVVRARLPEHHGEGFGHLDAAVLELEAGVGSVPPPPFARFTAAPHLASGGVDSLCTIGFPGPPAPAAGDGVDWGWVVRTLFGGLFGYKRLSPGRPMAGPGSVADDTLGIVCSHDATTFGGASGSVVLAWTVDDAPAFGLHFAGATNSANYMISVAKTADWLRAVGVPVQ